jgi:hypothetical protein
VPWVFYSHGRCLRKGVTGFGLFFLGSLGRRVY